MNRQVSILLLFVTGAFCLENRTSDDSAKEKKALSVFNVVSFPNSVCSASSGYNGTCYTASECTALSGAASGTCASSFGVCCVFSMACGSTSRQNNSYAIVNSFSTSTDADPCKYTICKCSSDVCKLRIDYDTMVLAAPFSTSSTVADIDGIKTGDCLYDTLQVTNPGGSTPPIICGTNTGHHMFVPASDSCNVIDINVDTGTTTTTRKWQIKVTQYECGNLNAPEQDCLQYLTAQIGTIASFNYDLTATSVSTSQTHLSSQYYDICFRRNRQYCSLCFFPVIKGSSTTAAGSFGLSASSAAAIQTSGVGTQCNGETAINSPTVASQVGNGDYIEILNAQSGTGTVIAISAIGRMCGSYFAVTATIAHGTVCTWSTPFKLSVHFDDAEAVGDATAAALAANKDNMENGPITTGSGVGFQGFHLAYWQNTC